MKYEPFPYQQHCIDRVINEPNIALWLEPGLGKTGITLTAIKDLRYNRWSIGKVLVVAPKKVAEGTWSKEAQKWDHLQMLRVSIVLGTEKQRIRALATPADIYITGRDNVTWLVDYYRNAWPFDVVVLDESSSFKNSKTKRFKSLKLVRSRINRLIELTGTPSSNGLIDLWAQIFLLDGGQRLGRTISHYRERFFDPDKRSREQIFSYKPKDGSLEYIQRAVGDICISMSAEDYLTLPERVYNEIPVVLDASAMKAYKKLERDLILEFREGVITAQTAGVLTGKLLQLCNGAVYDEGKQPIEIHNCKIEAFLELLEELNGKSVLVFYNYQHDRERILEALAGLDLRVRVYQSTKDENDWIRGEIDVLLAHPASCAYGLNLQEGGHHIIWFGLTWSLEQYIQANKRLHRPGQKFPVIIHELIVQGGMDEDVMKALKQKDDIQGALMEALKARMDYIRSETYGYN